MQLIKPYFKTKLTQERIEELRTEFSTLKSNPNKTNKQWLRLSRVKKWLENYSDLWPDEAGITLDRKRKATINKPD